jgi:hypothetical protein
VKSKVVLHKPRREDKIDRHSSLTSKRVDCTAQNLREFELRETTFAFLQNKEIDIQVRICALVGYYATYSGESSLTFRDNLSVPSSMVEKSKKTPEHFGRPII